MSSYSDEYSGDELTFLDTGERDNEGYFSVDQEEHNNQLGLYGFNLLMAHALVGRQSNPPLILAPLTHQMILG